MPHVDELVHDQHDPILVVSLASGDLAATDRDYDAAQSLITSCSDCARIHDDVLAIARATKALPPAQRTRDFRLTDADAAKLRPAGWRRLVGGFANGPLFSRQLGVGLATLGVAGLLLTALPAMQLGGMASSAGAAPSQPAAAAQGPAYESLQSSGSEAAMAPVASAAAASSGFDTSGGGAAPSQSPRRTQYEAFANNPAATTAAGAGTTRNVTGGSARPIAQNPAPITDKAGDQPSQTVTDQGSSGGPSVIAIVSTVLLVAGLLLLFARRYTRGSPAA